MESNDSPEIPDRGESSDIPGLPPGAVAQTVKVTSTRVFWGADFEQAILGSGVDNRETKG